MQRLIISGILHILFHEMIVWPLFFSEKVLRIGVPPLWEGLLDLNLSNMLPSACLPLVKSSINSSFHPSSFYVIPRLHHCSVSCYPCSPAASVLGLEPRAMLILGKYSITKLCLQPSDTSRFSTNDFVLAKLDCIVFSVNGKQRAWSALNMLWAVHSCGLFPLRPPSPLTRQKLTSFLIFSFKTSLKYPITLK